MANDLQVLDRPWTEAQAGDVLTVTDRYEDLVLALRTRAAAAGFNYLDLDHVAGLTRGHCGKNLLTNTRPEFWRDFAAGAVAGTQLETCSDRR